MSENIVNIKGKDYDSEKFDNKQKYYVSQIQDLQRKSASLAFQKDQVDVAKDQFVNALIASVEEKDEFKTKDDKAS
jgi:hypothetical protein|tara:strand:- start:801 stop:1028 length:228 start_codon:yes stop_codon:yes gene_type:complete